MTRVSKNKFGFLAGLVAIMSLLTLLLAACGDNTATTSTGAATTSAAAGATAAGSATTAAMAMTSAAAMTTAAGGTATTAAAGTSPAAGPVKTVAAVANGIKTGVTDTEIKLGSWGPQSGTAAGYGIVDRVLDAYFKKINEEGGINGRKIKFIYEDDAYQAAKTIAVAKKLVEQEKVFAVVGGIGTANNLGVKDYLIENGVPNIAFATGSGALVNPPVKNWFGLLTNYSFEGAVFAQYAADQLGAKKVAVVYQNDGFGKEGQQAFVKKAKELKLEVVGEVPYETGSTDLASQALRLQQSGADTVFVAAVPGPGAAVVKEMNKLGFKPKTLLTFVLNDPSYFSAAGAAAENNYTSSFTPLPDADEPKMATYRAFMKKYLPNEQLGSFSLWGYLGGQILEEGLKRAGKDLSRETLVAGLESIVDWKEGVANNISYGPTNRAPQNSLYILQYAAGKLSKVTEPLTAK